MGERVAAGRCAIAGASAARPAEFADGLILDGASQMHHGASGDRRKARTGSRPSVYAAADAEERLRAARGADPERARGGSERRGRPAGRTVDRRDGSAPARGAGHAALGALARHRPARLVLLIRRRRISLRLGPRGEDKLLIAMAADRGASPPRARRQAQLPRGDRADHRLSSSRAPATAGPLPS